MTIRISVRWLALALACSLGASPASATAPPWNAEAPAELRAAFASGVLDVSGPPPVLGTSATQSVWRIPIIRVAFSDSALSHPADSLARVLFDTTGANPAGSVSEYYWTASGGRLRVTGEVVATVQLPYDRLYYSGNVYGLGQSATPHNVVGAVSDALVAADPTVDWNRFDLDHDGFVDMLWIVHAGYSAEQTGDRRNLWSITSRLSGGWLNSTSFESDDLVSGAQSLHVRLDRFSVMPELTIFHPGALTEMGLFAHEFGHALGLPDLYDTASIGGSTGNQGPGNWSLMGTGNYGGDGHSPERPTTLGAWALLALDWAPRVRITQDTTVTLAAASAGGPVLDVWFEGEESPEHFLLENRQASGFDLNIPSPGLLVWQAEEGVIGRNLGSNRINSGPIPGLRVIEGDGDADLANGVNRGDANDPLPGALGITRSDDESVPAMRSLSGAPTNVSLENIRLEGSHVVADVRVKAVGWTAPRDAPGASIDPVPPGGPAVRAVHLGDGRDVLVGTERIAGQPQAVLRERLASGAWLPPFVLSDGAGAASDPSIVRLPGDDLAAAWSQQVANGSAVTYRSRIAGVWTAPRVLSSSNEDGRWPTLAADAHGRVVAAWYDAAGGPRLRLLRFLYTSPFGTPMTITRPSDIPAQPMAVCAPGGLAYVVWIDEGTSPPSLTFVRSAPDSAPTPPARLLGSVLYPHRSFGAVMDSLAILHVVWQVSVPGASEIHYQRRPQAGNPVPRDTLLDARGDAQRDPMLALDGQGNVHLLWQRTGDEGLELRYERFRPGYGWDYRATRVSPPEDDAGQAALVARGYADVGVFYVASGVTGERLRECSRSLGLAPVASVGEAVPVRSPPLQLGPNPVRFGSSVRISAVGGSRWLGVYDTQGRRLARVELDARGEGRFSPSRLSLGRPGLFFVRGPEGATARLVVFE